MSSSQATESPPSPPPAMSSPPPARSSPSSPLKDIWSDIFLWRKKKLSISVLAIATAAWVVLELYEYNFVTVSCWILMALLASSFIWANFLSLIGKEVPSMRGLEVSEEYALEAARRLKWCVEEAIRGMFVVAVEKDWFVFTQLMLSFCILALLGGCFHCLTLLYIGVVLGLSFPIMYAKYEEKIKECGQRVRREGKRLYEVVDNQILRKMKRNKVISKDKKME